MSPPDDGTALTPFASDVETLVQHADVLIDVLSPLHERHLQGEPVQEELNAVFQRHGALRRVTRWALLERLEGTLDQALETDVLEKETRQEFDEFWKTVDWITPGYAAYKQESEAPDWTGGDLEHTVNDGRVIVEHSFQWGVDEIHRIRAPVDAFVTESVVRLGISIKRLCALVEENETVSPQVLETVCKQREELREIVALLSRLEEELDLGEQMPEDKSADGSDGDVKKSELSALFESGSESTEDDRDVNDDGLRGIH